MVAIEAVKLVTKMEDSKTNTSAWTNETSPPCEMNSQDHWVTEMFPVTYTLVDNEDSEKPQATIFQQLAQQLSPLDETALKNVYEKVWLMLHLQEQERLGQEKEKTMIEDVSDTTLQKQRVKQDMLSHFPQRAGPLKKSKDGLQVLTSGVIGMNLDDSSIWSSDEIGVLRKVFKKTKDENHELKAEIHALKSDINQLTKKCRRAAAVSESRSEKLNIAVKANDRLRIAVENQKSEFEKAQGSIVFLHDELKKNRQTESKRSKEIHHLRLDLDHERLLRQKLEHDMHQEEEKGKRNMELAKERLSARHQSHIDKLKDEMKQLKFELQTERENHRRSKRALDHLRTHFASTDLPNENTAVPGPVTKDQLTKWTY